ncbi:MAG: VWA domain-containing protein [Alphaproteobacteria bacterium]
MIHRPPRSLEVLSISALDLFASALGVFVLIAVILFPFYLKEPSIEADLEGARAELEASGAALTRARQLASEAAEEREAAEAALESAVTALAAAVETERQWTDAQREARGRADEVEAHKSSIEERLANIHVEDLDLVFVMDTTGSMGEEIRDVQANLLGIVRVLQRLSPSLRVGFVAFKDRGYEYVTSTYPLQGMNTGSLKDAQAFVNRLGASGGGDYPEAVTQALHVAVNMPWREDAKGRIVVVGDAPAHVQNWGRAFNLAAAFQLSLDSPAVERRVSAVFSGTRDRGADFYERLAQAGGGDFVRHRGRMMESVLLSVLTVPE